MLRFYPPRHIRLLGLWLLCTLLAAPAHASAQSTPAPSTDAEVGVLQSVLNQIDCFNNPAVEMTGNTYSVGCMVAAGHFTSVFITRYATPTEAQTALAAIHGEPNETMGCYLAEYWMYYDNPTNQTFRHHNHVWAADKWLVEVYSFDDTYYNIAYEPSLVSGFVMQAAQTQLFPACHQHYLPGIFHP